MIDKAGNLRWGIAGIEPTLSKSEDCTLLSPCQLSLDTKAELGSMLKALIRPGISSYRSPNEQKPRESSATGDQKNNYAGTAKKKNRKNKVAQRFLVAVEEKKNVSDSDDDNQLGFGGVATPLKAFEPTIYQCPSL